MTDEHRCWAEIDQSALRHNAAVVRERMGGGVGLLAVVKANGYGHGMLGVAKSLKNHAELFGVANLEEATHLRSEVSQPIIILGPSLSMERPLIAAGGFVPSVSTFEEASDFDRVARDRPVEINLVIDTGMGRMGVLQSEAIPVFKKIAGLSNIKIHSVSTHLPVSAEEPEFTRTELQQFTKIVSTLRSEFNLKFKTHALPSAGVLTYADWPFDIVRAGLILYGITPTNAGQELLRPVLTWKTRISLIRDMPTGHGISYGRTFVTPRSMRVATLSAGYADGYPRHLSNRGADVLIRGQRSPLLGIVTMDLMMVDVSAVEDAMVGDEVVLLGRQGDTEVSAIELADRAGTITWEITTRIGSRVRRVYV